MATALGEWGDVDTHRLGEGQFSVAVLVGSDLVVRFPKHQAAIDGLRVERSLVATLLGHLDVALPEPVSERLDLPVGAAFTTHRLVRGVPVSNSLIRALDPSARRLFEAQTASLLTDLIELPRAALAVGVRERTLDELGMSMTSRVDRWLARRLTVKQAARAADEIASFSTVEASSRSLCHTDVGGNLIWDQDASRLGVIDWGGSVVSDAVLDLGSLSVLGDGFAASVARNAPHLASRLSDVDAVRATFVLQHALHSAQRGDWDDVDSMLADY